MLASVGQAAFVWDIATDAITWSDQASAVFADVAPASLATGASFPRMIEPTPPSAPTHWLIRYQHSVAAAPPIGSKMA